MSDIFSEVEEDIRREQMAALWRRFGPLLVLVALLLVMAIGGWQAWRWYSHNQALDAGARYEAALALAREGKNAEARAAFSEIAAHAHGGYAFLARFRAAGELAEQDRAAAVSEYDALAADTSNVPLAVRDLARLRAAYLLIDSASQEEVRNHVEALAAPGSRWRHTARELLALAALKAGDTKGARSWAEMMIADLELPAGLRQRAQIVLDLAVAGDPGAAGAPPEAPVPAAPSIPFTPSFTPQGPAPSLDAVPAAPGLAPPAAEDVAPADAPAPADTAPPAASEPPPAAPPPATEEPAASAPAAQ